MKMNSRLYTLLLLWMLMAAGAVGLGCGGSDGCPAGQVSEVKFGTTAQPGCVFTCLGDGDCPDGEFCEGTPFQFDGICQPCSSDSECLSDADCGNGGDCVGCQCSGGNTGNCPTVDASPGSVPFGGACDQNEDCADSLPCVDCTCV
jgi:hypothetical protein